MSTIYTGPIPDDLNRIPDVLKARPQWVLWRGADKIKDDGTIGLNKIPIDPQTLNKGSTTDPDTWNTFEHCTAALSVALEEWELEDPAAYRGGGIGFVFTFDDPFVGVDLDNSIDTAGNIAPWAQGIIDRLQSYTQRSCSGTGLHVVIQGTLPPGRRQDGNLQMWEAARFFAMTGWRLPATPEKIESRQGPLEALWCEHFAPKPGESVWCTDKHGVIANAEPWTITHIDHAPDGTPFAIFTDSPTGWPLVRCERVPITHGQAISPPMRDDEILAHVRKAKNAAKFEQLWTGDITGYPSQSEADAALCCILAFWTQNCEQIRKLFEQSALCREKWLEREDYRYRTIERALQTCKAFYHSKQRKSFPGQQGISRPCIQIHTDVTGVINAGEDALLNHPEAPIVYQRARQLSIIARGMPPPKWLHRPHDMPIIIEVTPSYIDELVTQVADFEKWDAKKEDWVKCLPPKWFVSTLQGRPSWRFPLLEGIICNPTLRPDGSILDTSGYDPDTALYLDTGSTDFSSIPLHPNLDDARSAIGMLQEALIDFPFAHRHHFSAALAGILSLACRFAVQGNVPLFAIRATTRGSGKSLLADTISIIGTGRPAPRWPQVVDPDEERKRLLTVALAGLPCVHIDNVTRPLGSPALDLALTASSFSDRVLGKTESQEAPLHMVWLASGNNIQFHGDTARRVVPIDLDPQMEKPEERDGFQHNPLLPWLYKERPRLTIAALTIIKSFFVAGCPSQDIKPLGSFEQWSALIRQTLIWTGEADPCEGRKDIEAESDPQYERLAKLLDCWDTCYPNQQDGKTLKQVGQSIDLYAATAGQPSNNWDELRDALGAYDPKYDGKRLNMTTIGNAFRTIQGRVIDNKRLIIDGTYQRAAKWKLTVV